MEKKRNYSRELEELISSIPAGERPALLLHACCAPCSSYCLEYLTAYFDITVLFYNPNMDSPEEYEKRLGELRRFVGESGFDVRIIEQPYRPEEFLEAVRGLEGEREGGSRCMACYRLRMEMAARTAASTGADYFTTTLSISPMKNAQAINRIGEELSEKWGVAHLPSDFKKKNGYKRSIELSGKYGLYRQDYCGCSFSKREREMKKEACK